MHLHGEGDVVISCQTVSVQENKLQINTLKTMKEDNNSDFSDRQSIVSSEEEVTFQEEMPISIDDLKFPVSFLFSFSII